VIKIRFRDLPEDISRDWLKELVEISVSDEVIIIEDIRTYVDLEFTGPYGGDSDDFKTPVLKRIKRFGYIKLTKGHHLAKRSLSTGIQPSVRAKSNIWFTGENKRPPQGDWDGYLSFDSNLPKNRNVYLPLWMLACTNLFKSNKVTDLWKQNLGIIEDLLLPRKLEKKPLDFCCSFIGKTYPMRLHALEALSKISAVDVFGSSVRNIKERPAATAKNYRFCLCFENDIYPGYVTEKPFEAYISGTIPLYYGFDVERYLNPKAVINLMDFDNISSWSNYIKSVHDNNELYEFHYTQPLLIRMPSLDDAISLIRKVLSK